MFSPKKGLDMFILLWTPFLRSRNKWSATASPLAHLRFRDDIKGRDAGMPKQVRHDISGVRRLRRLLIFDSGMTDWGGMTLGEDILKQVELMRSRNKFGMTLGRMTDWGGMALREESLKQVERDGFAACSSSISG